MPRKYHIRKAETWVHSYECRKYTRLFESNEINCQLIHNCLVKITFILIDCLVLFAFVHVSFQIHRLELFHLLQFYFDINYQL
uniref:Uncharacterized protein n=1 Tax=Populus trichocarpa TaxID=3694 RepID=A0A2K1Y5K9_POPTR